MAQVSPPVMPLMRVEDILRVIPHTRILAGAGGLSRVVKSVTVMDSPEIAAWLRGEEFLLVNGYFLRDDPKMAQKLVREVALAGAAAMGIKLHRFIEDIPPEAVAEAERQNLPLIELPQNVAWRTIIDPVYSNLNSGWRAFLEQSNAVFRELVSLVRGGKGPADLVNEVSQRLGRGLLLLDAGFAPEVHPAGQAPPSTNRLRQLYRRWYGGEREPLVADYPPHHPICSLATDVYRIFADDDGGNPGESYAVAHISVRQRRSAFLVVAERDAPFTEADLIVMLQAREVLGVVLSRDQALIEEEVAYRNHFLMRVLSGESHDVPAVLTEARHLGWDLTQPFRVMVLDMGGGSEQQETHDQLVRLVQRVCSARAPGFISAQSGPNMIILVPVSARDAGTDDSRTLAGELALAIQRAQATQLRSRELCSFGIGRVARALSELPRSYAEATQCLEVGKRVRGPGVVAGYPELSVYLLLRRLCNSPESRELQDRLLGPVEQYDREHQGELIETLQTFLSSRGGVNETAEKLFVHRNTVRLRLTRVKELTGFSLDNPDHRLLLEILLRLRQLQEKPVGGGPLSV